MKLIIFINPVVCLDEIRHGNTGEVPDRAEIGEPGAALIIDHVGRQRISPPDINISHLMTYYGTGTHTEQRYIERRHTSEAETRSVDSGYDEVDNGFLSQ